MSRHKCHECGIQIGSRDPRAKFCWPCNTKRDALRGSVSRAVQRAVREGLLADLKREEVPCADCGARADRYDHRDYLRPLDVAPVCRSCNCKRGHAVPCLLRLEAA